MNRARDALTVSRQRRWALLSASLLALTILAIAVWLFASLFGALPLDEALWKKMDEGDKATATSQWRLMLVQVGVAAGAIVAVAFTALTYRLSRRGQFTERFTKALERLEAKEMYLRVGAIHSLGHVYSDSRPHRDNVTEVLCSFLSNRAQKRSEPVPLAVFINSQQSEGIPSDVQAALGALVRRRRRLLTAVTLRDLDLSEAALEDAHLEWANLSGTVLHRAYLARARLDHAVLVQTRLQRGRLREARLRRADLTEARLQHASLVKARLKRAILHEARLQHANLSNAQLAHADLTRARLQNADLTGANLWAADLSGANLIGVVGVTAQQLSCAVIDEKTSLPDHLVRVGWWIEEQKLREEPRNEH